MTWFPVLEANQGALTLAALVLALVLALWEQRRANEQGRKELKRELQQVMELISGVTRDVRSIKTFDDVRLIIPALAQVLRGLAAAQARRPSLALSLLRTAEAIDTFASIPNPSGQQRLDFSIELISYYMAIKEGERGLDWRGLRGEIERRQTQDREHLNRLGEIVRDMERRERDQEGSG